MTTEGESGRLGTRATSSQLWCLRSKTRTSAHTGQEAPAMCHWSPSIREGVLCPTPQPARRCDSPTCCLSAQCSSHRKPISPVRKHVRLHSWAARLAGGPPVKPSVTDAGNSLGASRLGKPCGETAVWGGSAQSAWRGGPGGRESQGGGRGGGQAQAQSGRLLPAGPALPAVWPGAGHLPSLGVSLHTKQEISV